ncbi:MAG: chemotaxis protein CheC [Aliidongia sp.]
MTDSDSALSELQRDALTEVVNIGVSRAAVSLRKMVGEQVIMSVPALELISRTSAAKLIRERRAIS